MKGKNQFTPDEINLLRRLIRMRIKASQQGDRSAQKRIRDQMRAVDFYGGDDFGIHDLQLEDLDRLIASGRITILGGQPLTMSLGHPPLPKEEMQPDSKGTRKRQSSDESYVIDLCDEVLRQKASR